MNAFQRAQWRRRMFDADRRREKNRRDRANSTAQHEAGHALVGLLLGLTPRSISIEPGSGSDGRTTWAEVSESHGAFENIIVRVAGSEAEKMFGSADEGHESDLKLARGIAEWIDSDDDDIDDVIERAHGCACRILKANFAALTSLAVALLDKRTLDRSEIEEIIAAAPLPDVDDGDDGDDDADERSGSDDGMLTLAEYMEGRASGRRAHPRLVHFE
jgi:ATP-dependent Zn protease